MLGHFLTNFKSRNVWSKLQWTVITCEFQFWVQFIFKLFTKYGGTTPTCSENKDPKTPRLLQSWASEQDKTQGLNLFITD